MDEFELNVLAEFNDVPVLLELSDIGRPGNDNMLVILFVSKKTINTIKTKTVKNSRDAKTKGKSTFMIEVKLNENQNLLLA